jgi:hypothetical protein
LENLEFSNGGEYRQLQLPNKKIVRQAARPSTDVKIEIAMELCCESDGALMMKAGDMEVSLST